MRISIGILAWNEEPSIGLTIASLARQSLVARPGNHFIEIVVVPNGCRDNTSGAARDALAAAGLPAAAVRWKVVELLEPGKTNAWNVFVHELSDPDADVLVLADADILFHGDDTLASMIGLLESDPHVVVATDMPVKDIALKQTRSLAERVSLAVSGMTASAPGQLTGQLYAARAPALRRLRMPAGLVIDDGFIKQMICTDFLRRPLDHSRVARAADAAHVFQAYVRLGDVLPNQRRQVIGHAVYTWLRDAMRAAIQAGEDPEAWLQRRCLEDPDWFRALVRERVRAGGWWVMPPGMAGVRWRRWKKLPYSRRVTAMPAVVVGTLLDLLVLVWANKTLKSEKLKGIWKDTRSEKLGGAARAS